MPNDIRAAAQQAEEEITANEQISTEVKPETTEVGGEGDKVEKQSEVTTETKKTTPQVDTDPLQFLETLKLDEAQKKLLKDGFLRQADYTRKTQEVASKVKLLDEYEQFKPYIDKVLADPNLKKLVFEENKTEDDYPDDPKAYAERVKQETLAEVEKANQEQRFADMMDRDTKTATELDPRLSSDPIFMKAIAGIVNSDPSYILNGGSKNAIQATKDALDTYKTWEQTMRADYRKELENEAQKKRMVIPQGGTPIATAGTRPMSIREAAIKAEEELAR